METFNIRTILASMERKPLNKEVFCTTDHLKAQVMRLEAGTAIPPCKMDNDVLFYFLKGEGTITVDNEILDIGQENVLLYPTRLNQEAFMLKLIWKYLRFRD